MGKSEDFIHCLSGDSPVPGVGPALEIEQHQVHLIEQMGPDTGSETTRGIQGGVQSHPFHIPEDRLNEALLGQWLAPADGQPTVFDEGPVSTDLLNHFTGSDLSPGFEALGVRVVAIQATQGTSRGEEHKSNSGTIHGSAGFDRMQEALTLG